MCEEKVILALFETLKPSSQETGQIFKNVFYKSVLEILFTYNIQKNIIPL